MHLYSALSIRAAAARRRQSGFSLVELMVALSIGLIVSLAVMMGYLGASQSQRGQSDLSRMQETARFTFDLFGRETRIDTQTLESYFELVVSTSINKWRRHKIIAHLQNVMQGKELCGLSRTGGKRGNATF